MTEAKWLASNDPQAMLAFATGGIHDFGARHSTVLRRDRRPSERKVRLFAVAVFRARPEILHDDRTRVAVEVAERWADDEADYPDEVTVAAAEAWCVDGLNDPGWIALEATAIRAAQGAARTATHYPNPWSTTACDLLRDIVGNPYRPVTFDPAWRTPDVLARARVAYEERLPEGSLAPTRLAVLAGALEEAGCAGSRQKVWVYIYGRPGGHSWQVCHKVLHQPKTPLHTAGRLSDAVRWAERRFDVREWHRRGHNGLSRPLPPGEFALVMAGQGHLADEPHPLLAHLRSPGPHWRGCWGLDLVLEKE